MSGGYPMLTRADRAHRREKVMRDWIANVPIAEIARRHGLSEVYVREVGRQSGVARSPGRPRTIHYEGEQLRQYAAWRRNYGAATAREMMGAAS